MSMNIQNHHIYACVEVLYHEMGALCFNTICTKRRTFYLFNECQGILVIEDECRDGVSVVTWVPLYLNR